MVATCFFVFISLIIICSTESLLVNITILESALQKGAVCLDGSPPAYHLDKGFGTGVNNWLLSIEGGGWCHNVTHCLQRKNSSLGSSAKMKKQTPFSAMMTSDPKFNPEFYNWNRVAIRYCDGGSFTGDVEEVDPGTGLHYRGARIFKAIMEDLLIRGMNSSKNAILSGCSAGGLASILHCDYFRDILPKNATVKCFSDAGFFLHLKDISGQPYIEEYFNKVVTLHGSTKNLPPSCTSRLKPSLCFFPENVAQHVQTPLFIINAAYDHWQVRNILVPSPADPRGAWSRCKADIKYCLPTQLQLIQGFRMGFLNALKGLGASSTRGYYINSCFSHCQTQQQAYWFGPKSPRLFNKTIAEATGDWFFGRHQFQQIDCPYPCDKTCVEVTTPDIQGVDL